ncbi:MAG: DUF1499 domain-containing protein [Pseudomonadales bacterium]
MTRSILLVLGSLLFISGCVSPPRFISEDTDYLPACARFPNCVNSMSGKGGQAIEPLSATQVQWQELIRFIKQQNNWSVALQRDNFVQAVSKSSLMRFRDDIQLLYKAEQNLIHVRSSSRFGVSDMGVNRKRVEFLRQILEENR